MAFKDDSLPNFAQTLAYKTAHPGYATPSALTVTPRLIAGVTGSWSSLDPGALATAQPICQANANGHYTTLRAVAGAIALFQCITRNMVNLADRGQAASFPLGEYSGMYVIEGADNPLDGVQAPCWLFCDGSKYGARVAGIVTAYTSTPNYDEYGNTVSWQVGLSLLRPVGGLCLEPAVVDVPVTARLLALQGAGADLWPGYGPNSNPIDELLELVYSYPWLLEEDELFNPENVSETLTKVGHPSLSSLVLGLPNPVGTRWLRRHWEIGAGGWSKVAHISNGAGGTVVAESPGFETLRLNATGHGPGAGLRTASFTGWANQNVASEDVDPDGKFDGLFRGPVAHHLYDHTRAGNPAPWQFKRTTVVATGISAVAATVQKFPDCWVENGLWDADGAPVAEEGETVVYRRKVKLVHGIQGTKAAAEKELASVATVTLGGYDFIEDGSEIAGSNVVAYFRHPLTNVAKAAGLNEEDIIVQRRGAGFVVQIQDGVGWTNYACPASVSGRGGYGVQPGHCLVVPDLAGIPRYLWDRLIPLVHCQAGASPGSDPAWDGSILDGGIAGQPANYADYADKMDVGYLWKDLGNTWGKLVVNHALGGPDPESMEFNVVRGARVCNVYGVYPVTAGTLGTAYDPVLWLPGGEILIPDREATTLAVDLDLYEEMPPLSLSGDRVITALENILGNGFRFGMQGGSIDRTSWAMQVEKRKIPGDPSPLTEVYPGEWQESDGTYIYTYSFTTLDSSHNQTQIGVYIAPTLGVENFDNLVAGLIFYLPVGAVISPELDRSPVDGAGIAAAYLNASVGTPSLAVVNYETDENGALGVTSTSTETSPTLSGDVLGVNHDGEGNIVYTTLPAGAGGAAFSSGVETEIDVTEFVKAYVDGYQAYESFALRLSPSGFSPGPDEIAGIGFMKKIFERCWSDSMTWNIAEGRWEGTITTKYLSYDNLSFGYGHVEFLPAQFTLPAEMRVN